MMIELTCPKCLSLVPLTAALVAPFIDTERKNMRAEIEREASSRAAALAETSVREAVAGRDQQIQALAEEAVTTKRRLEEALAAEQGVREALAEAETAKREAVDAKRNIEVDVQRRVDAASKQIAERAAADAHADAARLLQAMDEELKAKDAKIAVAQEAELAARKARQEAEEAKRNVEVDVQRRVDAVSKGVAVQATAEANAAAARLLNAKDDELKAKDAKIEAAQDAELAARRATQEAEEAKRNVEVDVQRRIDAASKQIAEQAAAEAHAETARLLSAKDDELKAKDAKIVAAQDAELVARKARQQAEEAQREAQLEVQRQVDTQLSKVREDALREKDDESRRHLADKDRLLDDLRSQIEDLRLKGASASQQRQGDGGEIDLTELLQSAFPNDGFQRTVKGQKGADVLQHVRGPSGLVAGSILWESKRTKTWSEAWLGKLRDDQREIKADLAALVSDALPGDVDGFNHRGHVWVTGFGLVLPLASALRQQLIETATARQAMVSADSKKDLVYQYLIGPDFRRSVTALVEVYKHMLNDLQREKRLFEKHWAAREQQLSRLIKTTARVHGDLHGIVGASLPQIPELDVPQTENDTSNSDPPALSLVPGGKAEET
jgi:hypothetical protein